MNLTVRSERCTAVAFEVELVTKDNLARTVLCRYSILNREVVQPHDNVVEEMNEHYLWDIQIWKGAGDPSAAFLDNPNATLDVPNMFGNRSSIDDDLWDMIRNLVEFIVHENCLDSEPCSCINDHNTLEKATRFGRSTPWSIFNRR